MMVFLPLRQRVIELIDLRLPLDPWVTEDIEWVTGPGGEFRDNRPARTRLEPVPGAGGDGELLAWGQPDLVPDPVVGLIAPGRAGVGGPGWRPFYIEEDVAPPAPEGFLLAWLAVHGGVLVLGAGLPGEEDQLFGAIPGRIHVDDQLESGAPQVAQPEIRDLDPAALGRGQHGARPPQHGGRAALD